MDVSKYLVLLVLFSLHFLGNGHEIEPEKPTKLSSRNFHTILSLDDPWIVVFLEDYAKKEPELIALATSVVGVVQVGFIDMDDPECDELIEAKVISHLNRLLRVFTIHLGMSVKTCLKITNAIEVVWHTIAKRPRVVSDSSGKGY